MQINFNGHDLYKIAKLNVEYKRAYKKCIAKNEIDILENYINDYLINLSNYIAKKIETIYIKYNELEKTITLKDNKDNILKIKVYNQYLQFFYNNATYIIKDAGTFIDFIEDFYNNIENLKNFKLRE